MGPSTSSLYLWLGALLVLITAIQQPMQSILVTEEPKLIVTCNDNPTRTNNDDKTCDKVGVKNKVIAYDPEPQELEKAPQIYVVHRTLQNILSVSSNDVQPRLWRENLVDAKGLMDTQRQPFRWIYSANSDSDHSKEDEFGDYYVSSILNGTNTGVLREHAVRMDSRAQCQHEDSFPDECAGDNPFTYTYTSNLTEVKVCAEGSINTYPFTRSRNKQEISERIWFSLQWIDSNVHRDSSNIQMENYTMSCEATTRRGWFELGNYQNDFQPSGMLEKWPSQEDLEENFNDYTSASSDNDFYPVEEEASTGETGVTGFDTPMNAFGSTYHDVSSPLMMAALALFGNNTYFHTAANTTEENTLEAAKRICQSGRIPFAVYSKGSENGQDIQRRCSEYTIEGYEEDEDDDNWSDLMSYLVGGFLQTMEYPEDAQRILEITMFFANEALLTGTAEMGSILGSRSIYAAPGYQVLKPQKTLAGIIVITILIGLQTFGLLFLLRFIYSIPAWTGSFDSDALVQIGGQLREQDQRLNIGSATGLVGILARDAVPNTVEEEASDGGETLRNRDQGYLKTKEGFKIEGKATVPLALGGPGIVTKRVHKKTL